MKKEELIFSEGDVRLKAISKDFPTLMAGERVRICCEGFVMKRESARPPRGGWVTNDIAVRIVMPLEIDGKKQGKFTLKIINGGERV